MYHGSAIDRKDGFTHFSKEAQVAETLRKHFARQRDLLSISVDPVVLPVSLAGEVEEIRNGPDPANPKAKAGDER